MPKYTVLVKRNKTPWEPDMLIEEAQKIVEGAGGKVLYDFGYAPGFIFEHKENPIDPKQEPFKDRIYVKGMDEKLDYDEWKGDDDGPTIQLDESFVM